MPSKQAARKNNAPPTSPTLHLTTRTGSVFTALRPGTLIIHSCNASGAWGAGLARQLRTRYPEAFEVYKQYCQKRPDEDRTTLLGGAMLIFPPLIPRPPHDGLPDADEWERLASETEEPWIGCLFVRETYGAPTKMERDADGGYQGHVLRQTKAALELLLRGIVGSMRKGEIGRGSIREVRMPRINAGLFGVPWDETRKVLEGVKVAEGAEALGTVVVYDGVEDRGR